MQTNELSCPLGHTCSRCLWYQHVRGIHPQTGQEIDRSDCSINWLVMLGMEGNQKTNQLAATMESARNVVHQALTAPPALSRTENPRAIEYEADD